MPKMPKIVDEIELVDLPKALGTTPREDFGTRTLFRVMFGDCETLGGVLELRFIWVEDVVFDAADDGEVDWGDIMAMAVREDRPITVEDFPQT